MYAAAVVVVQRFLTKMYAVGDHCRAHHQSPTRSTRDRDGRKRRETREGAAQYNSTCTTEARGRHCPEVHAPVTRLVLPPRLCAAGARLISRRGALRHTPSLASRSDPRRSRGTSQDLTYGGRHPPSLARTHTDVQRVIQRCPSLLTQSISINTQQHAYRSHQLLQRRHSAGNGKLRLSPASVLTDAITATIHTHAQTHTNTHARRRKEG